MTAAPSACSITGTLGTIVPVPDDDLRALVDMSGCGPPSVHHSIVRMSPSRRSTRGSQPSTLFATVMSGRRRRGSSTGSGSKTISLELPVFNQNQGNIAIERATRRRLQDEYQARLDTAYGAADRLITELELIEAQYRGGLDSIRRLRDAAKVADQAYAAGNLDERSYVDLHASLLAKEIETHKLEQTLIEQRIALQTLIGSDIPARSTNRFSPQ